MHLLHLVDADYLDEVDKGAPDEGYRGGALDDSRHRDMTDRHWRREIEQPEAAEVAKSDSERDLMPN